MDIYLFWQFVWKRENKNMKNRELTKNIGQGVVLWMIMSLESCECYVMCYIPHVKKRVLWHSTPDVILTRHLELKLVCVCQTSSRVVRVPRAGCGGGGGGYLKSFSPAMLILWLHWERERGRAGEGESIMEIKRDCERHKELLSHQGKFCRFSQVATLGASCVLEGSLILIRASVVNKTVQPYTYL